MSDMFKPIYDIDKYILIKVLPHIKPKIIERIVASKWYTKFYDRLASRARIAATNLN